MLTDNARRLCEVFCISQNLQMYEVPERASDGKASGRCSGSPKGFRYIVLQLQEVGDFGDENCLPPLNLIRSTKLHLTTEPPISCRCCYLLAFSSVIIISFVKPSFAILILVKCFSDFCSVGNQRSEEHTSELQSRENLLCCLLLEKK